MVALLRDPQRQVDLSVDQIDQAGGPRAALDARFGLFADNEERRALGLLDEWKAEGIITLAYSDDRYPRQLTETSAPPPLLFLRGKLTTDDSSGVAIIGTRVPTSGGIVAASQLAAALVSAGRTVVSGLAAGIDTAAHTAALVSGGRSIGVLGTGLRHAYPSANAVLQTRLQVLVSQFWPEHGPEPANFPRRNAVMAAISSATVIVEAGERSGSRIQARHAVAQGRPLILMAPLLTQEWARSLASQAGVRVISSPDELIAALGSWTV